MLKSLIVGSLLFVQSQAFAAADTDVTLEEIQNELNTMDENLVLDQEDTQFLSQEIKAKESVQKNSKDQQVIWGKAIKPVQKAMNPSETNTLKK